MFKRLFLGFIVVFAFGWFLNSFIAAISERAIAMPYSSLRDGYLSFGRIFSFSSAAINLESPFDHIKEEQIHVYDEMIVLDIENASWASFADTKSMDPLLDSEANGIEIKPKSIEDVHVGDVISYKPEFTGGLVIHRVIETGFDENGWYAIAKGDNNNVEDPQKIRFEQINGVLVAVIY